MTEENVLDIFIKYINIFSLELQLQSCFKSLKSDVNDNDVAVVIYRIIQISFSGNCPFLRIKGLAIKFPFLNTLMLC